MLKDATAIVGIGETEFGARTCLVTAGEGVPTSAMQLRS